MKKITEKALKLKSEGNPFVLAEIKNVFGSSPGKTGSQMLIDFKGNSYGTVGGGLLESEVIGEAGIVLKEKRDKTFIFDMSGEEIARMDMICGGQATVNLKYIDPKTGSDIEQLMGIPDESKLYIFGGGHVALQLYNLAILLEIPTVIMDDREEFSNSRRFPNAETITLTSYSDIPDFDICGLDMIVIMTRGHKGDMECLEWAVRQRVSYIGMIGSIKKKRVIFKNLEKNGINKNVLDTISTPIGLSINAKSPAEIAVSIGAEIIQHRNTATSK
jgi:xanthine dehydrogenase accessory factor